MSRSMEADRHAAVPVKKQNGLAGEAADETSTTASMRSRDVPYSTLKHARPSFHIIWRKEGRKEADYGEKQAVRHSHSIVGRRHLAEVCHSLLVDLCPHNNQMTYPRFIRVVAGREFNMIRVPRPGFTFVVFAMRSKWTYAASAACSGVKAAESLDDFKGPLPGQFPGAQRPVLGELRSEESLGPVFCATSRLGRITPVTVNPRPIVCAGRATGTSPLLSQGGTLRRRISPKMGRRARNLRFFRL